MLRLNMVIADNDGYYADSLSAWLINNHPAKLNIEVYTQKDSIKNHLAAAEKKVDILLITPDLLAEIDCKTYENSLILLCSKDLYSKYPEFRCVNKYQPADRLLNQILGFYCENHENGKALIYGDSNTRFINIFSPQGASGKTTLSLILAHQLACLGRKTLYLSFRSLNPTAFKPSENAERNFSKLIYYIKQYKNNFAVHINSLLDHDSNTGLYYIAAPDCSLELDELDSENLHRIFTALKMESNFDYVITVCDSSMTFKTIAIMEYADLILMPVKPDTNHTRQIYFFDSQLQKIQASYKMEIRSKINIIENLCSSLSGSDYPYPVFAFLPDLGKTIDVEDFSGSLFHKYAMPMAKKLCALINPIELQG